MNEFFYQTTTPARYSFAEMCQGVGKPPVYVRRLQHGLGLHVADKPEEYSGAYFIFMEKVVALRTFNVPLSEIRDLFAREKRILELLHFDSMSESPTWYLDACASLSQSPSRLLLTGHDLGFPIRGKAVQANLDFSDRESELFAGVEMGEDVHRILRLYVKEVAKIKEKVQSEEPVLKNALAWSVRAFQYSERPVSA